MKFDRRLTNITAPAVRGYIALLLKIL